MSLLLRSLLLLIFIGFAGFASGKPRLEEIRTASDRVLVLVFRGGQEASADYMQWINTKIDVAAENTDDRSVWKINGQPPLAMHKFVTESSGLSVNPKGAEYYLYLEIPLLVNATRYAIETTLGDTAFVFTDRTTFCESVKTNQTGYSALSKVRYAYVAVWGGRRLFAPIGLSLFPESVLSALRNTPDQTLCVGGYPVESVPHRLVQCECGHGRGQSKCGGNGT